MLRNVQKLHVQKTFFKKWANPGRPLLLFIFCLFKQTLLQILQQINVKKCPSSMRRWDSNPQPSEYESPPTTTGPWLPPRQSKEVVNVLLCRYMIQIVVLPFKYISHTLSLLMNIL